MGEDRDRARRRRGLAALLLGAISISLGVIAAKEAYRQGASPQEVTAARLVIAAPIVAVILPFVLRAHGGAIGLKPLAAAVGAGATLWLGSVTELEGLELIPAGMLVLLLATTPAWLALYAWIARGEVPAPVERFALVAVLAGIAVMAVPLGTSVDVVGTLLGAASAICFVAFLLLLERNPRVTAAAAFPLGIIGAALCVLATDPGAVGELADGAVSTPLALAMGGSAAGWALLVGFGFAATNPLTAALIITLEPVLVALLAFFILGEGLSTRQVAGGVIVLSALAAVTLQVGWRAHTDAA